MFSFNRSSPSTDHDSWIQEYFRKKNAGAEFLLPWTIDIWFSTVDSLKALFNHAELKTIIDAHKNIAVNTSHLQLSHLLTYVLENSIKKELHPKYGSDPQILENKFRQLDEVQITVLILWSSAFWRTQSCSAQTMEKYLA